MLILTRKKGEKILILDSIEITIIESDKNKVKLGIKAPKTIKIIRDELLKNIRDFNVNSSQVNPDILEEAQENLKYFK